MKLRVSLVWVFCESGRWKDRLIIPIHLNGDLRGFVGRSIYDPPSNFSKLGQKLWSRVHKYVKVLNPKGFNSSRLVFNYDAIEREMIITEGIFDALNCGPSGVALFGKHMSNFQEDLIRRKKVEKIYVMLDADALKEAKELATRLSSSGQTVFLVKYPKGDPGEMSKKSISYYLQKAQRVSPLKYFSLKKRLDDVYK